MTNIIILDSVFKIRIYKASAFSMYEIKNEAGLVLEILYPRPEAIISLVDDERINSYFKSLADRYNLQFKMEKEYIATYGDKLIFVEAKNKEAKKFDDFRIKVVSLELCCSWC